MLTKNLAFTIIELIITMVIIAIIAGSTSAILSFFMRNTIFLPSQMNVQQAADAAMDIMIEGDNRARGLHFATITAIDTATNLVRFTNSDGQSIRYRIGSGRVQRSIDGAAWENIPYYATGNLSITSDGSSLFNYFDTDENPIASPDGNHDLVRRIKINLLARTGTGAFDNLEGQVRLASSVKIYKFNYFPTVVITRVTPQKGRKRYMIVFSVNDADGGRVWWNASVLPPEAGYIGDVKDNPLTQGDAIVSYNRTIYFYYAPAYTGVARVGIDVDDHNGGTAAAFSGDLPIPIP